MIKYAQDITTKDTLVLFNAYSPSDSREVIVQYVKYDEDEETIYIEGFFDDNGDEFVAVLDTDQEVTVK